MTPIADLIDRLNHLAKRREDEGIYTDAMIASSAAICISALEARLDEARKAREPVCWIPTATAKWLGEYDGPACATQTAVHNRPIKSDGGVPLYAAPLPLSDLEAENARLKAEVERLETAHLPQATSDALLAFKNASEAADEYRKRAEAAEARLAEALKALEPFASVALLDQTPDAPRGMWVSVPFGWLQDARRVREGGKVDG